MTAQSIPQRPSRSLSRRLLWFTIGVMLATEILVFLPGLATVRRSWLESRVATAELAVLAAAGGPAPLPTLDATAARLQRREVLRLAGVLSVRLQEPGRPFLQLAENGQIIAAHIADLREETQIEAIGKTLDATLRQRDDPLLVLAASRQRTGALLSVVLEQRPLTRELRAFAVQIALQGLAIAGATGGLVYWSLVMLLVRPMRRLTGSIQAFRADPEHTPPLDPPVERRDEIAVAASELAAMQRELRAALWRNARLAAIGTAVAKVSHDLRGILSTAMLAAERLQSSEDERVRRNGDSVASSIDRATELVKRTLDFAKSDPSAPDRQLVGLRAVAEEAGEQARAVRAGFELRNEVPDSLMVRADRMHLLRILGNLMRNAAEAGAGHVAISAETGAEAVAITLRDDGPGLPAAIQRDLFRPFVAGGRRGGSGLGMAIAQDLMRAHGGDIVLTGTGPDGTGFRLTLPQMPDMT